MQVTKAGTASNMAMLDKLGSVGGRRPSVVLLHCDEVVEGDANTITEESTTRQSSESLEGRKTKLASSSFTQPGVTAVQRTSSRTCLVTE